MKQISLQAMRRERKRYRKSSEKKSYSKLRRLPGSFGSKNR